MVTVIGLGIVVAFRRRDDRLHRGGRRTLGRTHRARPGQLLVRGIPHRGKLPSAVRGLVIAVIKPSLEARAMKCTRAPLDCPPTQLATRIAAVDLTPIVTATDAELRSAPRARSATMIVQARGTIAGLLALSRGMHDGQRVSHPRGKGGREVQAPGLRRVRRSASRATRAPPSGELPGRTPVAVYADRSGHRHLGGGDSGHCRLLFIPLRAAAGTQDRPRSARAAPGIPARTSSSALR